VVSPGRSTSDNACVDLDPLGIVKTKLSVHSSIGMAAESPGRGAAMLRWSKHGMAVSKDGVNEESDAMNVWCESGGGSSKLITWSLIRCIEERKNK
jgi:hypothetical protein